MESVIGFIKQKNETGILVEGKWYNPSDNVKTFYAQCKVNNKVKMQVEGSVIVGMQTKALNKNMASYERVVRA